MAAQTRIRRGFRIPPGGRLYLVGVCFVAFAAYGTQVSLLFWMFGLMAGLLLIGTVMQVLMLGSVRVQRLRSKPGAADETIMFRYKLTNHSRIFSAFGVMVTERVEASYRSRIRGNPIGMAMHIRPSSSECVETLGFALQRGVVQLRKVRITTAFPFGATQHSLTFDLPCEVVIYPRIFRVRRDRLFSLRSRDDGDAFTSQTHGGTEEFYGLREYRRGDPLKFVDWKQSARTGAWISREMTRPSPPALMVVLDLRNGNEAQNRERAERAISLAASIVCEALAMGFEVGLAAIGVVMPKFAPRTSRWHRTQMLEALGSLALDQSESIFHDPFAAQRCGSIVIHVGAIDPSLGPPDARHISEQELETWRIRESVDVPAPKTKPKVEAAA